MGLSQKRAILTPKAIAQRGLWFREVHQELIKEAEAKQKLKTEIDKPLNVVEAIFKPLRQSKKIQGLRAKTELLEETRMPVIRQIMRKGFQGEGRLIETERAVIGLAPENRKTVLDNVFHYTRRDIRTPGDERQSMINIAGATPTFNISLPGLPSMPGFNFPDVDWGKVALYGGLILGAIFVLPRLLK